MSMTRVARFLVCPALMLFAVSSSAAGCAAQTADEDDDSEEFPDFEEPDPTALGRSEEAITIDSCELICDGVGGSSCIAIGGLAGALACGVPIQVGCQNFCLIKRNKNMINDALAKQCLENTLPP